MSLFSKFRSAINKLQRKAINQTYQKRLTNQGMSVISANCVGAFILHDLNQPFNSPFVNLYLDPSDFVRYLQNIEFYQAQPLQFIQTEKSYPVGLLDDLKVHFMHYHSEQEAKEKWEARSQRLDFDNLFIMMTDKDGGKGAKYEALQAFDNLPYPNKVVFTRKPYPELKSAFYIKGFENENEVGDLFTFSGWNGEKYYDQFDYVSWFNQK
ncbi:exopolysaccharide biosynthesis protein [Haemophilus parainfluenzae]|uniref:DUF1919 domain-containing protein n=1 Tax=Haemophilus parainfluenzae TaxID=729 RepID=UPI0006C4A494|nr:DUF1919 domain-containing protein [Haemophilus parainfluenzae]KOT14751.1 exopolysaccharide biosynthesis protein [Haemophilus parainfluenzae]